MTWSEFFLKVSIKQPGPSQKKMIVLFDFRDARANFWSLLNDLIWIFGKKISIEQPLLCIFFQICRSLEQPGLLIESLEYVSIKEGL